MSVHTVPGFSTVVVSTAIFILSAACDLTGVSYDVSDLITIDQGVYGQATTYDDTSGGEVEYMEGLDVEVFLEQPSTDPEDGATPHASARSGERGFWEIELAVGDYWLCTSFRRCIFIAIDEGTLLRKDYVFGFMGGWPMDPDMFGDTPDGMD
jgi:hypothetical protein